MMIRITVENVNDKGEVIASTTGETDNTAQISDISQWVFETVISIKHKSLFPGVSDAE